MLRRPVLIAAVVATGATPAVCAPAAFAERLVAADAKAAPSTDGAEPAALSPALYERAPSANATAPVSGFSRRFWPLPETTRITRTASAAR